MKSGLIPSITVGVTTKIKNLGVTNYEVTDNKIVPFTVKVKFKTSEKIIATDSQDDIIVKYLGNNDFNVIAPNDLITILTYQFIKEDTNNAVIVPLLYKIWPSQQFNPLSTGLISQITAT